MRLIDLHTFVDVATSGSMSRVAEKTGASQPGISRIIRELENEAGTRLLVRTGRGVDLTEAGERYLRFARECIDAQDALKADLAPLSDNPVGNLQIAVPHGTGWLLIPALQRRFAQALPQVTVSIFEERVTSPAFAAGSTNSKSSPNGSTSKSSAITPEARWWA